MEVPSIIYACVAVVGVAFIARWYTDPVSVLFMQSFRML